jgi:hypothetical protein
MSYRRRDEREIIAWLQRTRAALDPDRRGVRVGRSPIASCRVGSRAIQPFASLVVVRGVGGRVVVARNGRKHERSITAEPEKERPTHMST